MLLGGDNMDLALAYTAAQAFAAKGLKLDAAQMVQLAHSARSAKETILGNATVNAAPVTVLGRGSKVIAGTIKGELTRADVEKVLLDGFFPTCPRDAEPGKARTAGFQELGLPYVADAAVTRHLAHFLSRQALPLARPCRLGLRPQVRASEREGDRSGETVLV